jgi:hypothetical protein
MMIELMEMFGELGDRIAVQYGGSEAHNKMAVGTGTGQKSSSKKGELLTSIKRYYSNSFTDNAKQDAMNLFLGCYVPGDHTTPLWELDNDYNLHNLTFNPPEPYINKVIFNEMLKEIKYFLATTQNPLGGKFNSESFHFDLKESLLRYAIRLREAPLLLPPTPDRLISSDAENDGSKSPPPPRPFASSPPRSIMKHHHATAHNMALKAYEVPHSIQKSILRSEKRKFISHLMKTRLNDAIEHWWRRAIVYYEDCHRSCDSAPYTSDILVSRPYFYQAYRPFEFTSFDEVLRDTECFAPISCVDVIDSDGIPEPTKTKVMLSTF